VRRLARASEPSTLADSPSGKPHTDATPRSARPNSATRLSGVDVAENTDSRLPQAASEGNALGKPVESVASAKRVTAQGRPLRRRPVPRRSVLVACRSGQDRSQPAARPRSKASGSSFSVTRGRSAQTALAAHGGVVVTVIPRRLEWSATMVQRAPRRPPRLFTKSAAGQRFLISRFESWLQS
jgi:hypothetical protein